MSGHCGPMPLEIVPASWMPPGRAFAESGLDVGVEEIARRAGVGKGTLYRRFPTKEALVRAIFDDILDELQRIGVEAPSRARCPRRVRDLPERAPHGCRRTIRASTTSSHAAGRRRADRRPAQAFWMPSARPLERAQAAGAVREDLVPEDVLDHAPDARRGDPAGAGRDPMQDHWRRYLGLLLDSLRAGAATTLPAKPWRVKP